MVKFFKIKLELKNSESVILPLQAPPQILRGKAPPSCCGANLKIPAMITILQKTSLFLFLVLLVFAFMCISVFQPTLLVEQVNANPMLVFNNENDILFYVSYMYIVLAIVVLAVWYMYKIYRLGKQL